jgi:uncharacterized protein (TIGR02466 family)
VLLPVRAFVTAQDAPWLESSDVLPMFPTLVWKLQLAPSLREAMDPRMLAAIEALRAGQPPLAPGEGWQSQQALHEREAFREFAACVDRAARSVLRFLHVGYGDCRITGCWANILAPGAAHRAHRHPNNFLSGVYYLRAGEGADAINFHDPRPQTGIIRPPVTVLTAENTDQVVVRVKAGTLLLFPAWLEHSVDANRSGEARISVSFNLMFGGFAEHLAKPMW